MTNLQPAIKHLSWKTLLKSLRGKAITSHDDSINRQIGFKELETGKIHFISLAHVRNSTDELGPLTKEWLKSKEGRETLARMIRRGRWINQ